jgi:hypothetical protein
VTQRYNFTSQVQSWPKAASDTKTQLYNMVQITKELHEQVPLVHQVFDLIEDKGAVLIVSELCEKGTLSDAVVAAGKIDNIPWLVCEVRICLYLQHISLGQHLILLASC